MINIKRNDMETPLNYEVVFNTLVEETENYISSNKIKSMVLGISGGIDSTVVASICCEVSKNTGIPLIGRSLSIKNKEDEYNSSILVGQTFCSDFKSLNLYETYTHLTTDLKLLENTLENTDISEGNIQARLRMIYLYNIASITKGIVMSTDNQTEYQLGFWTIHGDVGDFDPLQDLWKTEVYKLAEWIKDNYSSQIKEKGDFFDQATKAISESMKLIPTDGLGISNSDLEQIGANSYEEVDKILQEFFKFCKFSLILNKEDNMKSFIESFTIKNINTEVIKKVLNRHITSEFKRKKSPIFIKRNKYENHIINH